MKNYRLAIFRHGLTQANLEGIYAGAGTDLPLCEAGVRQLEQLKKEYDYPQAQAVFVSPLRRCAETAEILYPGVKQYVIDDLREVHFGEFEGKKATELTGNEAYRRWMDPQDDYTPEGGENGNVFAARTRSVLMKLFEFMFKSGIADAACVTHGGVAMSMLAQRALPERPAPMWACDAGCGYLVQCSPELWMRDELVEAQCIVPYGYGDEAEGGDYAIIDPEEGMPAED